MAETLQALADCLRSARMDCQVDGDPQRLIESVAALEEARPADISFLSNPRYLKQLDTTRAGAVVVSDNCQAPDGLDLLRVRDPYAAITLLIVRLHGYRRHPQTGISLQAHVDAAARIGPGANIHPGAAVAAHAVIGANVTIYPGCYVAEYCRLGDDCVLMPNVVLYDHTVLGDRVTIHAGTVVGNDGLGYAPVGARWEKIPQIGHVEIGDDVEIGANCAVDRATLGKTVIGSGTKFSNLIAIGHGSRIGAHCMFVAQVGLAGSVSVGEHVVMAGQVGVAGHLTIGDRAQIAAKAGVTNDVPPDLRMLGQPAMPMNEAKRVYATFTHLPAMRDKLRALEARVAELEAKLNQ